MVGRVQYVRPAEALERGAQQNHCGFTFTTLALHQSGLQGANADR